MTVKDVLELAIDDNKPVRIFYPDGRIVKGFWMQDHILQRCNHKVRFFTLDTLKGLKIYLQ